MCSISPTRTCHAPTTLNFTPNAPTPTKGTRPIPPSHSFYEQRQAAKKKQDELQSDASKRAEAQSQAVQLATDAAAAAEKQRAKAEASSREAERRAKEAEAAAAKAMTDVAAAKGRMESEVKTAKAVADVAKAEAAEARSASGMDGCVRGLSTHAGGVGVCSTPQSVLAT